MTLQELRKYAAKFNIRVSQVHNGFAVYRIMGERAVYQGHRYSLPFTEALVKKLCDSDCNGKA